MEKRPIKSAQPNLAQLPLLNPSSSLPTTPYPLITLSPARLLPSVPCPPPLLCPLPCLLLRRRPPLSPPSFVVVALSYLLRDPPLPPPSPASASSVPQAVRAALSPGGVRLRPRVASISAAWL
jgi:hypothetical protein